MQGTLDLSLVGMLARIANALANTNMSIFTVSTFDAAPAFCPLHSRP